MSPSLWIKQHCNPGNVSIILSVIACHGKQRQLIDWRKPLLQQNTTSWFISFIEITYWTSGSCTCLFTSQSFVQSFPLRDATNSMKGRTYCNKVRDAVMPQDFPSGLKKPATKVNGKLFLCNEKYAACVIDINEMRKVIRVSFLLLMLQCN